MKMNPGHEQYEQADRFAELSRRGFLGATGAAGGGRRTSSAGGSARAPSRPPRMIAGSTGGAHARRRTASRFSSTASSVAALGPRSAAARPGSSTATLS